MPEIRRQATLFLDDAAKIEAVRNKFNPKQAELIAAHVTLCREDEVTDWNRLAARFNDDTPMVSLEFGTPVRDSDLVFIPGIDLNGSFRSLRKYLLETEQVRDHKPHITLIHPRNGKCSDEIWDEIRSNITPFTYTFRKVSFILQQDGGAWETLHEFALA